MSQCLERLHEAKEATSFTGKDDTRALATFLCSLVGFCFVKPHSPHKYARKLRDRNPKNQAFGDDYVYLFGHKIPVTYPGSISLKDETKITFKDQDDLLKKMRKVYLNYMQARTKAFADSMKCPNYIVKVRQMKSRYGSNNKAKKTITYSLTLIHYSAAIIDSVVVHELAHCFVYNHSDSFYRVVYKYCPEYDKLRKKLIRAEFE